MLLENVLPEHMLPDFLLRSQAAGAGGGNDYTAWAAGELEFFADMGGTHRYSCRMLFMLYAFCNVSIIMNAITQ
jgi:hypothetical protein